MNLKTEFGYCKNGKILHEIQTLIAPQESAKASTLQAYLFPIRRFESLLWECDVYDSAGLAKRSLLGRHAPSWMVQVGCLVLA